VGHLVIVVGKVKILRVLCDEGVYLKVLAETDRLELMSIISAFEREQPIDVSSTAYYDAAGSPAGQITAFSRTRSDRFCRELDGRRCSMLGFDEQKG